MIVISCKVAVFLSCSTSEIGKQMGKSVAPMLLLDTHYVDSITQSHSVPIHFIPFYSSLL